MTATKGRISHRSKHTLSISKCDSAVVPLFLGRCYVHYWSAAAEPQTSTTEEDPESPQDCLGNTCEQKSPSCWAPAVNPPKQQSPTSSGAGAELGVEVGEVSLAGFNYVAKF